MAQYGERKETALQLTIVVSSDVALPLKDRLAFKHEVHTVDIWYKKQFIPPNHLTAILKRNFSYVSVTPYHWKLQVFEEVFVFLYLILRVCDPSFEYGGTTFVLFYFGMGTFILTSRCLWSQILHESFPFFTFSIILFCL